MMGGRMTKLFDALIFTYLDVIDVIDPNELTDVLDAVDLVDACELVDANEIGRIAVSWSCESIVLWK